MDSEAVVEEGDERAAVCSLFQASGKCPCDGAFN